MDHLNDYDDALRRHRHHRRAHLKSVRADRSNLVMRHHWSHEHCIAAHEAAFDAQIDMIRRRVVRA